MTTPVKSKPKVKPKSNAYRPDESGKLRPPAEFQVDLPNLVTEEEIQAELRKVPLPTAPSPDSLTSVGMQDYGAPNVQLYFPGLTNAQNIFLQEWLTNGRQAVPAYWAAWGRYHSGTTGGSDERATRVCANRVLNLPQVRAVLGELERRSAKTVELTLTVHLKELAVLRDMAKAAGQLNVAVAAEVARGKAAGLYIDRSLVVNKPIEVPQMTMEEIRAIAEAAAKDI